MADCIKAIQDYIERMLKPKDKTKEIVGMKALLLDKETKGIIGMVSSMTEILEKEVFLVESLDADHDSMTHIKAICFLRPTKENLKNLQAELKEPKFAEYHLFFSNIVSQDFLRMIAQADVHSSVKQVQEYFADYYAINSDFYTLNLGNSLALSLGRARWSRVEELNFERAVQGVVSTMLSFKVKPYVRYQGTSMVSQAFAREITSVLASEKDLFSFRGKGSVRDAMLLILDRKEDPVTPLLTQWTYQAMVHELMNIRNNRVDLKKLPGVAEEHKKEFVLSPVGDTFFQKHMHSNFGDLGVAVRSLLEEYTSERESRTGVTSVEEMQKLMAALPELTARGTVVGKHVTLVSELARMMDDQDLMAVSEVEQEVACRDDASTHFKLVIEKINHPSVDKVAALRMVMLYALRYETSRGDKLTRLKTALINKGLGSSDVALVDSLLEYGGVGSRGGDLFGKRSLLAKIGTSVSSVKRGMKGVENVYTQHSPLLSQTLESLVKGKLSKSLFPFAGTESPTPIPSLVVVFVIGGVTYEEAAKVSAMNASGTGPRIVLGGTAVHNSKSFSYEISRLGSVAVEVGAGSTGGGGGGGGGSGIRGRYG